MKLKNKSIDTFVQERNSNKSIFTPGPASLVSENITGLRSCFGRGDSDYNDLEDRVLNSLAAMSGHQNIVRLQGSATLALEIICLNFLFGKILLVNTGYYSDRLRDLILHAKKNKLIKDLEIVDWKNLSEVTKKYDWIVSCYTETSIGLRLSMPFLKKIANNVSAKLMIDATASIGLEPDHDLADVIGYSSCKGLFGLTGAAFIAYNDLDKNEVESFYLDMRTHQDKKVTGPYHAICSLDEVLLKHHEFRESVCINKDIFLKKMSNFITINNELQPKICTHINKKIKSKNSSDVLYLPRGVTSGSVICHLGEAHLGLLAEGKILESLDLQS